MPVPVSVAQVLGHSLAYAVVGAALWWLCRRGGRSGLGRCPYLWATAFGLVTVWFWQALLVWSLDRSALQPTLLADYAGLLASQGIIALYLAVSGRAPRGKPSPAAALGLEPPAGPVLERPPRLVLLGREDGLGDGERAEVVRVALKLAA